MSELFLKLLNMSITASWLILVVVALRLVLKKAPKWVNCLLWALVAVRLICPFSFESRLSLVPDVEPMSQTAEEYQVQLPPEGAVTVYPNMDGTTEQDAAIVVTSESGPVIDVADIAAAVWLSGAAVLLLYALISYLRLRRRVAVAMLIGNKVWLCDAVESPFILGFFRPCIYLPSNISEGNMEHVLAHERAHLQRRDHWWKPIGYVLLAVYWFNPLIWVAYILLCRDIELACDEKVIKRPETDRKAYSEALLACSVKRSTITACPLAFGEVSVRGRIKSVLNYKKPAFWIILVALVACVTAAVCFLTNPVKPTIHDVGNQKGYRITAMVRNVTMPVTVPVEVLGEDIYSNEGHIYDPDEVVVYQNDTTTVYLEHVRHLEQYGEEYLYFDFRFAYKILDKGTVRTLFEPNIKEGKTVSSSTSCGVDGNTPWETVKSGTAYYDSVRLYGVNLGVEVSVVINTDAVRNAQDDISFTLVGLTDITYEKGKANHEDDIRYLSAGQITQETVESAAEWVNYYDTPGVDWEESKTLDVMDLSAVLRWTSEKVEELHEDGTVETLIAGEPGPIWNVYLVDLNADGSREICVTASVGFGMIDSRVIVYDYAMKTTYELADRGVYDYVLFMEDGRLRVRKIDYHTHEEVMEGSLLLASNGLFFFDDAGLQLGKSIAEEFGNVPEDYQAYYNSEIASAIDYLDYITVRKQLNLTNGDKVPTYFLSPDKRTLIAVKQDKEGANYTWTFIKNESGEWELSEFLTKPIETVSSVGGIDGPISVSTYSMEDFQEENEQSTVYNNEKYGFSLQLPESWYENWCENDWTEEMDYVVSFYCTVLPEGYVVLPQLLIQGWEAKSDAEQLRLLAKTNGCYIYLYMPRNAAEDVKALEEQGLQEELALFKTMYSDMESLTEEAVTWWDGYATRIHPITGKKGRYPEDMDVLKAEWIGGENGER